VRKLSGIVLALTLAACAAPAIRLSPSYAVGEKRTYRLTAVAHISSIIGGVRRTGTTELRARSIIEVLAQRGESTRVALTVTPLRLSRDAKDAVTPPEEKAELVIGADGTIQRLISVGGFPPQLSGIDISDIAPLLGAALPSTRLHVGSSWQRRLSAPAVEQQVGGSSPAPSARGYESGSIAGLRRAHGYDCVVVSLSTRRPLVRDREVGGQPVRLSGTETAATENVFAFRLGFPVTIRTGARAVYQISNGSVSSGQITIDTDTVLDLASRQPA